MVIIKNKRRGFRPDRWKLAEEGIEGDVERWCGRAGLAKERSGGRREIGLVDSNRGNQICDEPHPVAVAAVEAQPEDADAGAAR